MAETETARFALVLFYVRFVQVGALSVQVGSSPLARAAAPRHTGAIDKDREERRVKLTVEERPELEEVEVSIRCPAIDRRVRAIMAAANAADCRLFGTDDAGTFIVEPADVLYAETVDGRTFLYSRERVLESPLRLYELEEALAGTEFVRASKSFIVNFDHVRALRPYLNARLELVLSNGESVIASRQYAPAIKQKIGL